MLALPGGGSVWLPGSGAAGITVIHGDGLLQTHLGWETAPARLSPATGRPRGRSKRLGPRRSAWPQHYLIACAMGQAHNDPANEDWW